MNGDQYKALSVGVLLIISIVGAFLPFLKVFRKPSAVGYGGAFAGGVFLSAALMELMPHALRDFDALADQMGQTNDALYPIPFLLTIVGYWFVMCIMLIVRRNNKQQPGTKRFKPWMGYLFLAIYTFSAPLGVPLGMAMAKMDPFLGSYISGLSAGVFINIAVDQIRGTFDSDENPHLCVSSVSLGELKSRAVILLIVFTVHSFVEGLALGVQKDSISTISILIAIVSHKGVEAFALGLSLVQTLELKNLDKDNSHIESENHIDLDIQNPPISPTEDNPLMSQIKPRHTSDDEEPSGDGFYSKLFLTTTGMAVMSIVVFWH